MLERRRRVVYLTDEEWAQLGRQAATEGSNRSEVIRGLMTVKVGINNEPKPEAGVTLVEPGAFGQQISARGTPVFNSKPFTPVPKKSK